MLGLIESYQSTVAALGAMATLMFVQLLIADVAGIRAGHVPGTQVQGNHSNFLFRVTRVVANCNESIAIFLLAIAFCFLNGASAEYTSYGAWAYVAARVAYALCYYFDLRVARSITFGVSLVALAALIGIGAFT